MVILLMVKETRLRNIIRTWWLGGLLALCLTPARLVSMVEAQSIAALQIAGLGVFLFGLELWSRRRALYPAG